MSFLRKIIAFDKDDRYKRNFFEWLEICQTAKDKSASAASREYYGTLKGQRVDLTPSYIKRRCLEVEKLADDGFTYYPMFTESMDLIMSLIGSDPVLLDKYNEIERQNQNLDPKEKRDSLSGRIYYYVRH